MIMGERLCVVMPVYNEQEAIGGVLAKWDKALKELGIDYYIRPYNDGSKDNSLKVMREYVAAHPECRIEVRDKPNGGHGNTILTGYREAAKDGFDWVFQIDSDDEMGPEKFDELWSRRNDYDFLVGIRDGRVQALPRKIISFVSRLCVKIFYGKSVWDVNTPYRLMRISAFKGFYEQIPLTTFAPNVILSGLAARHKLRSFETRVPQHDRTTGEVSIKKWKLFKAAAKSFWQTIVVSFNMGQSMKAGFIDFFRNVYADVKALPKWMFVGLGVALIAVYGITCTFPSMVYDFAAAKGDRFQVFLTYFFMRRYTEGAISALFYDFSPIWSNVIECAFMYAAMILVGVLGKRLGFKSFSTFIGMVLWLVSPIVYDRVTGQHCIPSHGMALLVDSIAMLLFCELRSSKRNSLIKLILLELCIIISAGEYEAHINLLLTAFCGICLINPRETMREWLGDILLIGGSIAIGVVGWFLLSYGPVILIQMIGVAIPASGGAHDHVFWFDAHRTFIGNIKSLLSGLVIDFGYNSFFSLGIGLAAFAWLVWLIKLAFALCKHEQMKALYILTFAFSIFAHPVLQCSTSVMRAFFWFMPFVSLSYMICCEWAMAKKRFCGWLMVLVVTILTIESCHETATLYYFRWKVLEQDRLHASNIANDLWREYGTKMPKPVAIIGSIGRYPTNWDDLRPNSFLPLIHAPFHRLFSNMEGYGYNCPREVYMYLRELVGFVCKMPDEKEYNLIGQNKDLVKTHPSYPQHGYIFEEGNTIIVNLGDPDERWEKFDYRYWQSPNEKLLFKTLRIDEITGCLRRCLYEPAKRISENITNY